jgi:multisubunit Na+/H+ antiporter MnhF subunit
VNGWYVAAGVLLVATLLPAWVALRRPVEDGLVALQVAGTTITLALLLLAEGIGRSSLSDLALVLAASATVGTLAFATLLERER